MKSPFGARIAGLIAVGLWPAPAPTQLIRKPPRPATIQFRGRTGSTATTGATPETLLAIARTTHAAGTQIQGVYTSRRLSSSEATTDNGRMPNAHGIGGNRWNP